MSPHDHDLPPLPKELMEGLRSMRRVKPSDAIVERALTNLPDRPGGAAEPEPDKVHPSPRWLLGALVAAPALAALAVVLQVWDGGSAELSPIQRSEERAVDLPEDGHAWTDLDLWTHHHEDEPMVVHLEVPENVRVRMPGDDGGPTERSCEQDRCIHRFTHRHGDELPLGVAVAQPGRYVIRVRHESNEAMVDEHFVLTALRD